MSAASHPVVETALAQHRVARLASLPAVHRAFHWLHLHQPQLRAWQMELLAIPAPPFLERERAEWFLERFRAMGLASVRLDREGNALAELVPQGSPDTAPCVLLSAHLDTVFPAGTPTQPAEEGSRILAPGACDNGAGLTALLAVAAALRFAGIEPPVGLLFAANVGEEGEGDLRGMRHLFLEGAYRGRIAAAFALEGSGTSAAVTRGLGSRRFRLTVRGPGGHSWVDAGLPNPIFLLARVLTGLDSLVLKPPVGNAPRTTLSAGQIAGGSAVNSIPEMATVLLDLRSTDPVRLETVAAEVHASVSRTMLDEAARNLAHAPAAWTLEPIGERPAAALPEDSSLLHSLRAVDRHLGLRTELRMGSTDANLPLSLGIPAMALAAGGTGGGIHTVSEWYDPTGREIALRRILLTLLDTLATVKP